MRRGAKALRRMVRRLAKSRRPRRARAVMLKWTDVEVRINGVKLEGVSELTYLRKREDIDAARTLSRTTQGRYLVRFR